MHEIRPAGNGRRLERQRLDQIRLRLRRRRDRRPLDDLVEVVDEPDVDTALVRAHERALDDLGRLVVEPEVVERELERLLRFVDEARDQSRNVDGALPAVRECVNLDQPGCRDR
jgi:hypothetical protein